MYRSRFITIGLLAPLLCSCASLTRQPELTSATAVMRNAAGATVGTLRLESGPTGVRINGSISGLSAGAHGVHLHTTGRCEGPEFTSAGPHLASAARKHGLLNPEGPHEGDLPAIAAGTNGVAVVDVISSRFTLAASGAGAAFDADGTSIVVHAANDDQRTDPSGNAGARIACGVIERP